MAIDSSYVILHSGNHEIYGVRDRETQTLYISDIVEVTCPSRNSSDGSTFGYGQLQVGFMLASIKEGIDRAKRFAEADDVPANWYASYDGTTRKKIGVAQQKITPLQREKKLYASTKV